jgi:DNA-binding GntR family transcriptional regulator
MKSPRKPRRATPAYQRLADDLRSALLESRFKEGNPLPTEAELAETYGVSRQTVRRAFQDLVGEGLVYRVPGRGTFPSNFVRHGHYVRSIGAIEDLLAFAGTEMELLQRTELIADEEAARRLELQSKVVALLVLRRLYEGVPFTLTHVYLPPQLGQRLAEAEALPTKGAGTVIGVLESLMPGTIAGANQVITAVPAPPDVASHIDYEAGQPCLRAERTYFDTEGIPIELAISFYNPNRYTYRLQMRRRAM